MAIHVAAPMIVRLPAEIDIDKSEAVCTQLCSACTPGVTMVIADLTTTTFCDCSGIGCLVQAHQFAAAHDAQLRLAVTHPAVSRIVELTGLGQLLQVYPGLAEALAGPAASP